ncbi:MAG: hypothetical protein F6K07_32635 [Okeania sp. SIO1H5]|uniref:hypothetical protein n=1 Tax=Okeania sp. SIO1H5 TaxID=2607777 RepID=UPI0013BDC1F8|nr:hypothetical protein [Okeania sp. SIO1H5]NET23748.1 hypothetical protein [Okeania sp. SIO1H5]
MGENMKLLEQTVKTILTTESMSWLAKPPFLRPWGKKADVLFAGPWVGDLVWELMGWQGFLRKLSKSYERVIVSCRPGHEFLYQDFTLEFVMHELRGLPDEERLHNIENPEELERVQSTIPSDVDHLKPHGLPSPQSQSFIPLGEPSEEKKYDILFTPVLQDASGRGWGPDKWMYLIAILRSQGYRVGCIGDALRTYALKADFTDLRGATLQQTIEHITSANLVVGPANGTTAMAALCKTPHLVWCGQTPTRKKVDLSLRYERTWNPFGAMVRVVEQDDWNPKVDQIVTHIDSFFQKSPER